MQDFNTIYLGFYKKIFFYLRNFSFVDEDAHDLAQDIFMKLYTQMQEGFNPENLNAWLYKCATNLAINKKNRKKIVSYVDTFNDSLISVSSHSLEKELAFKEKIEQFSMALEKLKDSERSLVLLYREGFSYREMSEILNIKASSVGKTLSRAIEKLSNEIKKENHEQLFVKGNIA